MKKRRRIPRCLQIAGGLLVLLLLLFYGPFESFRLLWINTAMYSSRFKFLAQSLYTEAYIRNVMAMNAPAKDRRTNNNADHNVNDIVQENNWDDGIFFTEIKGDWYKGYMLKINDPRRLVFAQSPSSEGSLLEEMVLAHGASSGINASGYADARQRGIPWGRIIADGQDISPRREDPSSRTMDSHMSSHTMGGLNTEHRLIVGHFAEEEIAAQNYLWAFQFGPLLIVNGEKTELTSFSGGLAPRSAIGQTAEGHILLVTADGRQKASIGATFKDMQTVLFENGAINAINLDGGSSSGLVFQGKLVSRPSDGDAERLLPNAIVVR